MLTTAPRRTTAKPAVAAFATGLAATCAGLAYTAYDQLSAHGLDTHLRALYDPVGKHGEPGPLYGFLYAAGIAGVLTWLLCLRLAGRGAPTTRRWSTWALVLGGLVVWTPVLIQEYGQPVLPWSLMIAPIVAWVAGLTGTAALWFGRRYRAVS